MTNTMRRLALALTLMLCAAIGVDAAGPEEAKGLLGQKKYEEAYAAIEQAVAEKDASVPVLTTGMSAALGSGRVIMASGLAKRFQDMRLLESAADRLRFGRRFAGAAAGGLNVSV